MNISLLPFGCWMSCGILSVRITLFDIMLYYWNMNIASWCIVLLFAGFFMNKEDGVFAQFNYFFYIFVEFHVSGSCAFSFIAGGGQFKQYTLKDVHGVLVVYLIGSGYCTGAF